MLRNYILAGLFLSLFTLIPSGYAEDSGSTTIISGVGISNKTLRFDIADIQFEPSFLSLDFSLAAAKGKFFSSIQIDQSILDNLNPGVNEDDAGGGGGGNTNEVAVFSRDDVAISVGYNFWKSANVFGGYKAGRTEVDFFNSNDPNFENLNVKLQEYGPFLGASYAISYGETATLGLSIAYASMKGEFKSGSKDNKGPGETEGDTTGFSYGVSWSNAISEKFGFTLGVKINRYKFKDTALTGDSQDPVNGLSSDENFTIMYLKISNYF